MGTLYVPPKRVMLMMLTLSLFIYIIMIFMYSIHSEYDNYEYNITAAEEVVEVGEHTDIYTTLRMVRGILIIMTAMTLIVFMLEDNKEKAQESIPVPEAEDSVEHNE